MPTKPRTRRRAVVAVAVMLLIAAGAYVAVTRLGPLLSPGGCRAGTGKAAIDLDPQQAAIAATIAGVAHHQQMPARAVTVAYAAAMQESKMHNLGYGDRDSVGVFQQRPSEGWGPARKLHDPVYATTKFFAALANVRGYQHMPVYQAAQAVQHSADGYAYVQYQQMAARLTGIFTGQDPHAVWCWPSGPVRGKADLAAASTALTQAFGSLAADRRTSRGDAPSMLVRPSRAALGWAVASWLVTHAAKYRIRAVYCNGFQWRAASAKAGWTRGQGAARRGEVRAS